MDNRIIAVQFSNALFKDGVLKLVDGFLDSKVEGKVIVFRKDGIDPISLNCIEEVALPSEADNDSKIKNKIFDYAQEHLFKGFLHIVDLIELTKDPSMFIKNVEHIMDVLDYSIYFSTTTDPCNYIFKKFNPRLTLDVDDDAINGSLHLPSKISFTSHSNTCWTVYDFGRLDGKPPRFNENFSIAMYLIIEYLARRRATRKDGQLYYMNLYLSILDEVGVFKAVDIGSQSIDLKALKEEDALFKAMKIDYAPDNNIDNVLDAFYLKLKEKMPS